MEINILNDKENFRHLNGKIYNKQEKKNESKHIMIKGNIAKSTRSTYKQNIIKKFISKSS